MKEKSILNEEYTEKIKAMQAHVKKANEIYQSLPDCVKDADKNPTRACLGNSVNFVNHLAWSFGIDTDD